MKIIFLDIDGVLNSQRYDRTRSDTDGNVDVSRLPLLKSIKDGADAEIVLTSTWRVNWDPKAKSANDVGSMLLDLFLSFGIALYDRTPYIGNDRPREVRTWLNEHPDVESFVIIDDIKFGWEELDPMVVKTDYRIGRGLEQHHVEKALQILRAADGR